MCSLDRVPVFVVVLFMNTRSMVDVCPELSSLVGTFGSFLRLNDRLNSHSRVSQVQGVGPWTLSYQVRSLIFQSPAMIVGVEWWGIWFWSRSAVHSWGMPGLLPRDF